jgi:hypothetical protein
MIPKLIREQGFVALGDSCTEGLDEPHPENGQYPGWADFVAGRLALDEPDFRYANLGVRGKRLDQITAAQCRPQQGSPDVLALFGGGNDVMHRHWNSPTVARRADAAISAATSIAPTVVVFTPSDVARRMPLGERMRPRIDALNHAIREPRRTASGSLARASRHRLPLLRGAVARRSELTDLQSNTTWLCKQILPFLGRRIRYRTTGRARRQTLAPTPTAIAPDGRRAFERSDRLVPSSVRTPAASDEELAPQASRPKQSRPKPWPTRREPGPWARNRRTATNPTV